jgi:hypothetical protein
MDLNTLREYLKIHLISLDQDLEALDTYDQDEDSQDWHYLAGQVTATGNITSAGNVSGGNLVTGGRVVSTGNIVGETLLLLDKLQLAQT